MNEFFRKTAKRTSEILGSFWAFFIAILIILIWFASGPYFHFSDTWQLVVNTGTTIVTFLMVFLIQNTQNRDAKALHLKIDELIRVINKARDEFIELEELSDNELSNIQKEFSELSQKALSNNGSRTPH